MNNILSLSSFYQIPSNLPHSCPHPIWYDKVLILYASVLNDKVLMLYVSVLNVGTRNHSTGNFRTLESAAEAAALDPVQRIHLWK